MCSDPSLVSNQHNNKYFYFYWDIFYYLAKGIGQVHFKLPNGLTLDVFLTHTIADDTGHYTKQTSKWVRKFQIGTLIGLINESEADLVILGGDLNEDPPQTGYGMILLGNLEKLYFICRMLLVSYIKSVRDLP